MIRLRLIRFQFRGGQHHTQEKPRPQFAADQIGVLALPAEPGLFGQRLFHQRRGIDKDFHLSAGLGHELPGELFQPLLQRVVIVPPPCVDGDVTKRLLFQSVERIMVRAVIERDDDGRFGIRPHRSRRLAPLQRRLHPVHAAMMASFYECFQPVACVPRLIRPRYRHVIKAKRPGEVLDADVEGIRQGLEIQIGIVRYGPHRLQPVGQQGPEARTRLDPGIPVFQLRHSIPFDIAEIVIGRQVRRCSQIGQGELPAGKIAIQLQQAIQEGQTSAQRMRPPAQTR